MSLLNQMLKDIDKRRAKEPKVSDVKVDGVKSVKEPRKKLSKWFYIIVAVAILVIVAVIITPKSSIIKPKVIKTIRLVKRAPKLQTFLQSIAVIRKNGTVVLQFMLNTKVHYKMQLNKDHTHLILTLDNTKFSGKLPGVSGIVKQLLVRQDNADINVHIIVKPGTQFKGTSQNKNLLTLSFMAPVHKKIQETAPVLSAKEKLNNKYEEALSFVAQDDLSQAVSKLQSIVKDNPKFIVARTTLATLLLQQKNYGLAQKVLQTGLQLNPQTISLIELYARSLMATGKNKEALVKLLTITPPIKENVGYYATLALVYQNLGKNMMALQWYEQLLKVDPTNARWWMGLGIASEALGKDNAALYAYQHAADSGRLTPSLQVFVDSKIKRLGA